MDNRIGEMEVFVRTVERGSFAAAAKALRLTPSAVSRSIARIEARLGVRLLQRTTRSLALTVEGEALHARASKLLSDVDELERSFTVAGAEPRGRLRVNSNVPFGMHKIIPLLPAFIARYPKMSIDLSLSDTVIDLLEERADVAIRVGPLRDSNLHARSLGRSTLAVIAAPQYLQRHGRPRRPADLAQHQCIIFNFRRSSDSWPFKVDGVVRPHAVAGTLLGSSGEAVRLMALAGAGITRVGRFHVEDDIRHGRLVPLLERYNPGDTEEINALYVSHQHLSLRVRAFVDFLVEHASVQC
jgi:DNA-binding transcriptional LysR family regulator